MSSLTTKKSRTLYRTTALAAATISSLTMSACAFKTDGPPPDPQISKLQQQLDASLGISEEEIVHEFIPGELENDYSVRVKWPANRPVLISLSTGSTVKTYDGRVTNSFLVECADRRLKYALKIISPMTASRVLNAFQVDEPCLTDYTIVRNAIFTDLPKALNGRLFMENGSKLLLRNDHFHLKIESLIVKGSATIQTFDESRDSSLRSSINAAPTISIRAKNASGLLKLELNGIDGPKVQNLQDITDTALNGQRGAAGTFKEVCDEPRESKRAGEIPGRCRNVCDQQPQDGGPALQPTVKLADGKLAVRTGPNGSPGVSGIGTSKVSLQVQNIHDFALKIRFNPGKASAPGLGALPKAGLPGLPGLNPGAGCLNANQGKTADDGLRGAPGAPAANGSCEIVSISNNLRTVVAADDYDPTLPCSTLPAIIQVRDLGD